MTKLVERIDTKLAKDPAFAYIADFAHAAEWDPNIVASSRIDDGELGVGSRFQVDVKVGPRTLSMEYRITEYDPPNVVVLVGEGWNVWSEDRISFEETTDGTRVTYDVELKANGVLAPLSPLLPRYLAGLGDGVRETMGRVLDRLAAPDAQA
jgi:carbon monoxide dehydrogenase subunit G